MKTIEQMTAEVRQYCVDKGWRGASNLTKSFGDDIALLHSEASEALEAYRDWGIAKMAGPNGMERPIGHFETPLANHGYPYEANGELAKPQGVGSEFADIFIRLLDDCAEYNIDLYEEYEAKMAFNRQRAYQHGGKKI